MHALDREITRLTEFVDAATADVTLEYYEAIDILQMTRDKAAGKLRELQAVNDQSWAGDEATTGMDDAWKEVTHAVLVVISMT